MWVEETIWGDLAKIKPSLMQNLSNFNITVQDSVLTCADPSSLAQRMIEKLNGTRFKTGTISSFQRDQSRSS